MNEVLSAMVTRIHVGVSHDFISNDDFADLLEKIQSVIDEDPNFEGLYINHDFRQIGE